MADLRDIPLDPNVPEHNPRTKDLNDLLQAGELDPDAIEAAAVDVEIPEPADDDQEAPGLATLALPLTDPAWGSGDWLTAKPEPRPMLLYRGDTPFLPMGKVGLLAAAGGTGKTQILTQLALAVASAGHIPGERLAWLDTYQVEQGGNVLLALGEEDREEVKRRLQKAARGMDMTTAQRSRAMDRLVALPLCGEDARMIDQEMNEAPFTKALQAYLATREWALIILDPGSRFMGVDAEKDNSTATLFTQVLETLTTAPGKPAVLVAMHTGKQGARTAKAGLATDDQYLTRGSSAFVDGARWACNMVWNDLVPRDYPLSFIQFAMSKTNYTKKDRTPVDLVMGEDGFIRAATQEEHEALKQAQWEASAERATERGTKRGLEKAAEKAAKDAAAKAEQDRLRREQDADC